MAKSVKEIARCPTHNSSSPASGVHAYSVPLSITDEPNIGRAKASAYFSMDSIFRELKPEKRCD